MGKVTPTTDVWPLERSTFMGYQMAILPERVASATRSRSVGADRHA
jgi:hypothetical protein